MKPNPRSTAIIAIARAHGLNLNIIYADKDNKEAYEKLLKVNPLGQVPTFVGSDGHVLTECISIALYSMLQHHHLFIFFSYRANSCSLTKVTSQSDTTTLLGSSRREYFDILKWMSYTNSDFLPAIGGSILPLIGRRQIIRQDGEDSLRAFYRHCKLTDNHLRVNKYVIGDRVTVADFFMVGMLTGAFMVFHKVLHVEYPSMIRWFHDVYNMPMYKDVAGVLHLLDLPFPTLPEDQANLTPEKQVETSKGTAVTA